VSYTSHSSVSFVRGDLLPDIRLTSGDVRVDVTTKCVSEDGVGSEETYLLSYTHSDIQSRGLGQTLPVWFAITDAVHA
jgi:hypothetical protein